MLKTLSFALTLATASLFSFAAEAAPPTGNFAIFSIENSPASGMGNPGFCTFTAHDTLERNGFTSIGSSSVEVWGFNGDTLVVIGCIPEGAGSSFAGVHIVAAGPDYTTTENWRNLIRTAMANVKWL